MWVRDRKRGAEMERCRKTETGGGPCGRGGDRETDPVLYRKRHSESPKQTGRRRKRATQREMREREKTDTATGVDRTKDAETGTGPGEGEGRGGERGTPLPWGTHQ